MFRLSYKKYVAALESTQQLAQVLRNEMEKLEATRETLSANWQGDQAEKSLGMIKYSLEEGYHAKALAYTEGMAAIMEEYLPVIRQLMARREQIGKNLHQDEYAEPDLSYFVEDELIIDYDYIASVDADCEGALRRGRGAVKILEKMIEETEECAGEYVNLSGIKEELEKAKSKLERIENYREAFNDFARRMRDFEESMSFDLKAKMREIGDESDMFREMAETAFESVKKAVNIDKHTKEILESVLAKDVSEWTQEDIDTVAKQFTRAINQKDTETLNKIAEVICQDTFDVQEEGNRFYGMYSGGIPQELLISILSRIDPRTEGEAFFTLTRLAKENYNIDINMGVFPYDKYETDLQFRIGENGELTAVLECVNHFNATEKTEGEFTFTTKDLYAEADVENMKELGFSEEEILAILSGIKTDTDAGLVLQLCAYKTEEEYACLFRNDPDNLSAEATMSYYLYSLGLFEKSFLTDENGNIYTDETHNYDQLTKFLNGMLSKPQGLLGAHWNDGPLIENYTMDYLAIMAINAEKQLEVNSALIYNDYENITEETINRQYKLWDMYAMYLGLESQELWLEKWDMKKLLNNGLYMCNRISNFGLDSDVDGEQTDVRLEDAQFSYSLTVIEGWGGEEEKKVLALPKTPTEVQTIEKVNEYNEKVKQAKYAPVTELIDGTILIASISCPELAAGISLLELMEEPDASNLGKTMRSTGATIKNYKSVGKGVKAASYVIDLFANIRKSYQDRDNTYEELLDDWFESGIKVSVKKEGQLGTEFSILAAKGMYDPKEIEKCRRLAEEGFAFMYDHVTEYDYVAIGEDAIDSCIQEGKNDVVEFIDVNDGRSIEERIEILKILWRGAKNEGERDKIKELTSDEFLDYVGKLSEILSEVRDLEDVVIESTENIFDGISLESEYKNYKESTEK